MADARFAEASDAEARVFQIGCEVNQIIQFMGRSDVIIERYIQGQGSSPVH